MRSPRLKRNLYRFFVFSLKLAFVIVLILGLRFLFNQVFTIRHISCQLDQSSCPDPVLAELERTKGQNLNQINTTTISQKILGSSPLYTTAKFDKSLPGKLNLTLQTAAQVAQVSLASASGSFVIANNYFVTDFLQNPDPHLPHIISTQTIDPQVGQEITNPDLKNTVILTGLLDKYFIDSGKITLATDSATTILNSGPTVRFNQTSDLETQIKTLQLILSQSHRQPISTIDLRFQKPVLIYQADSI